MWRKHVWKHSEWKQGLCNSQNAQQESKSILSGNGQGKAQDLNNLAEDKLQEN